MANFWAGFGQGFQGGFQSAYDRSAKRRDIKEAREQLRADQREVMEAEAGAYDDINKELREKLAELERQKEIASITDPNDPRLSVLNNQVPLPVFEEGESPELSRKELLKKRITGQATQTSLSGRISELKKLQAAQKLREQQLADIKDERDYKGMVRQEERDREDEISDRAAAAKTKEQTDQYLFKLAEITGETPEGPPSDAYEAAAWVGRAKNDQNEATERREQLVNFAPNVLKQFEDAGSAGQPMPELDYRYEDIIPAGLAEQAYNSARTLAKSTDRKTKLADAKKLADAEVQGAGDLVQFGLKPPTADNFLSPNGMTGYYAAKALASKKKEAYEAVQSVEGQTGTMGLPKLSLSQINNTSFEDLDHIINGHKTLAAQQEAAKELGQKAKEKMLPSFQPETQEGTPAQRFLMRQVQILNDPAASAEDKKLAEQMIELQGGTATTVYGEDGKPIVEIGRPTSRSKEDKPEPAALESSLMDLNRLARDFDQKNPSIGWIATVKSGIGDSFLPQFGVNSMSDPQRIKYRQAVQEFQVNYVKALNAPDSRLSDTDRKMLAPLAPGVNDSPVVFANKVEAIQEKISRHQRLNDAFQGKKDLWGMRASEITSATFGPNARLTPELGAFAIQEKFGAKELYSDDQLREVIRTQFSGKSEEEVRFFVRSLLSIGRLGDK